jgi:alanyl-tRNA synthetase
MKSADVRKSFLDFYAGKDHEVVPSSPLVPANDPTLLFTNAGMVQFKDLFLGLEKRAYTRATTSQRCVRAGGKHNDLENVGYTARHHTFFEMLGNFSFGDYFKREAIKDAWEFMTEILGLPAGKLWVTVFEDDDEAADIWLKEIGIDPARFSRLGEKDNFWAMGDTGPCGPCTEIFYDHGADVPGGPPGSPDEDGDRYVEVWNLVFMQYERAADGTMTPLPKPSVDTGMGLERIAAVMQGVHSNYDIDLFQALLRAAAVATDTTDLSNNSLKVISDHIRACVFLIADGVVPSNEGRGYVLRRIIRRAIRHGYQLGQHEPFFHKLVATLEEQMGEAYPELGRQREQIERVLLKEEQRFAETLDHGMRVLDEAIDALDGETIPGAAVFKLYDTYGFPVDLTADIARERGLSIDRDGFEEAMTGQRERARASSSFAATDVMSLAATLQGAGVEIPVSEFLGYEEVQAEGKVELIISDGEAVESVDGETPATIFLDRTPFYAESGGQVGDTGLLVAEGVEFSVIDTQKVGEGIAHFGRMVRGSIGKGDTVTVAVNAERRQATVLNHSATHLLHAALRTVLGTHVAQKGSLVAPDRLRFDFSHFEPVTSQQLEEIESLVNEQVRRNNAANTAIMGYDDAVASGAVALFGEKYGDEVRVLKIGDFSTELCGGTHVTQVGEIGLFKITSETGIAAGVRRIEALTGNNALAWLRSGEQALTGIAGLVKSGRDEVEDKVRQLVERGRQLEKEVGKLKGQLASGKGSDLAEQAIEISGVNVLAANVEGADSKSLRDAVDRLKNKLSPAVVVLAAVEDGKVRLVAGVTKETTATIKAGELINEIAHLVGGKGGGRPDMAQAGGNDPAGLAAALARVTEFVTERLS